MTQGPYSVCRNPLYFFSFIGLVGIGLATETVSLTLFLIAFFALVYPAVIAGEEEFLRGKFGPAYVEYCRPHAALLPAPQPVRRTGVVHRAAAHAAPFARRRDLVHRTAGRDPGAGLAAQRRCRRKPGTVSLKHGRAPAAVQGTKRLLTLGWSGAAVQWQSERYSESVAITGA